MRQNSPNFAQGTGYDGEKGEKRMYCQKCGKNVGEAKFCPECGTATEQEIVYSQSNSKQQRPPRKKRGCLASIMVFLIIVFFSFAAIVNNEPTTGITASGQTGENQTVPNLELLDHSTESDGMLRYVVGHIRNNTDKTYSYVQISINLYNDGTQVGSTLANVNNLEAGGTWEFKALITEESTSEYKIAEISGW